MYICSLVTCVHTKVTWKRRPQMGAFGFRKDVGNTQKRTRMRRDTRKSPIQEGEGKDEGNAWALQHGVERVQTSGTVHYPLTLFLLTNVLYISVHHPFRVIYRILGQHRYHPCGFILSSRLVSDDDLRISLTGGILRTSVSVFDIFLLSGFIYYVSVTYNVPLTLNSSTTPTLLGSEFLITFLSFSFSLVYYQPGPSEI